MHEMEKKNYLVFYFQGNFLDEASGVRKKDTPLVIASMTQRNPISGSWNKKVGILFCNLICIGLNYTLYLWLLTSENQVHSLAPANHVYAR